MYIYHSIYFVHVYKQNIHLPICLFARKMFFKEYLIQISYYRSNLSLKNLNTGTASLAGNHFIYFSPIF